MPTDTYTCAACQGVFEKGWTDEEAEAEGLEVFGLSMDDEDAAIVCDDCYKAMGL